MPGKSPEKQLWLWPLPWVASPQLPPSTEERSHSSWLSFGICGTLQRGRPCPSGTTCVGTLLSDAEAKLHGVPREEPSKQKPQQSHPDPQRSPSVIHTPASVALALFLPRMHRPGYQQHSITSAHTVQGLPSPAMAVFGSCRSEEEESHPRQRRQAARHDRTLL